LKGRGEEGGHIEISEKRGWLVTTEEGKFGGQGIHNGTNTGGKSGPPQGLSLKVEKEGKLKRNIAQVISRKAIDGHLSTRKGMSCQKGKTEKNSPIATKRGKKHRIASEKRHTGRGQATRRPHVEDE